MTRERKHTYFAIANPQVEPFVQESTFEELLYLHLLFDDRSLLIPDGFWFNSVRLTEHVLKGWKGRSLLLEALANRDVIPAFRRPGCTSFADALAACREDKIGGLPDDAEDTLVPLYNARVKGLDADFAPKYWPAGIRSDKAFAELAEKRLQVQSIGEVAEQAGLSRKGAEDRWNRMAQLRNDCIPKAIKKGQERGHWLTLGNLIDILLSDFVGYRKPVTGRARSMANVLTLAQDAGLKKQDLVALHDFIRLIVSVYNLNQASLFKAGLTLPGCEPLVSVVLEPDIVSSPGPIPEWVAKAASWDALFPNYRFLKRLDPEQVLKLRDRAKKDVFSSWDNAGAVRGYAELMQEAVRNKVAWHPDRKDSYRVFGLGYRATVLCAVLLGVVPLTAVPVLMTVCAGVALVPKTVQTLLFPDQTMPDVRDRLTKGSGWEHFRPE